MATMAGKRDYYEVLGVEARRVREGDRRRRIASWRSSIIPDSNPGDEEAVEKFKEAAEAYEVLSDAEKRARYDRFGHAGVEQMGGPQFHDVDDIFEAFGDIFGEMFGGRRRRRRPARAQRGRRPRAT